MKNSTFLSAKEKEECIVRYKDGESIRKLSKKYNVTARSIWRWKPKVIEVRNGIPI